MWYSAMNGNLSNEEKKRLSYERQAAVRKAWKEEQARVAEGFGTRKWSEDEQKELLERGAVSGYEGHHMKSVSLYPEYAGDSRNIQFLSEEEHLQGAHRGNYHNLTNGYYDPESKQMIQFGKKLGDVPVYELSGQENQLYSEKRAEYCAEESKNEYSASPEMLKKARNEYTLENEQRGLGNEKGHQMSHEHSVGRR